MPNRLATATSPYLRQHADNPVDWHQWGPEALGLARREDKPIHLSIGYAACHWCHVMAHESFEDPATARLLNEHFVNIKVDREERPDLDSIYMQAVQTMTGQGGWPMTVFLLPDGSPFFGGTYFPPEDRHGLPSFTRVVTSVAQAFRERRDSVAATAARLREVYDAIGLAGGPPPRSPLSPGAFEQAYRRLAQSYDPAYGGFGGAPKFPPSMALSFLLTHWARTGTDYALEMVRQTFRAMARGGVFDQLGGGLHRYSVDRRWLVPHFEKMLYDNALLVRLGVELWQATGDPEVRRTVDATLGWVRREMTSPDGGFYSSLDADSEGEEGTFYLWTAADLAGAAGSDAEVAATCWGVSAEGNFEGRNVLHLAVEPAAAARRLETTPEAVEGALERAGRALFAARERRPRPARDDKVVAAWNGLMLRAAAVAARAFGDASYRALALGNARFLADHLVRESRVRRSYREGVTRPEGFLEDQAAVALGFLEVFTLTGAREWLDRAGELAEELLRQFWDDSRQVLFDTAPDQEPLIARPRDLTDNATPSGTSLAVELLLRLASLTGREDLGRKGVAAAEELGAQMERFPAAFGHLLGAADLVVYGAVEVVIAGDPDLPAARRLCDAVSAELVPSLLLVAGSESTLAGIPLAAGKPAVGGRPAAYVCRRGVCQLPRLDPGELREVLRAMRRAAPGGARRSEDGADQPEDVINPGEDHG
jgi:hypothetical protein